MIVLYSESFHLLHIALDRFRLFRMFWKGMLCPAKSSVKRIAPVLSSPQTGTCQGKGQPSTQILYMSSAWKKTTIPSNTTPANRLASQSMQQPQPVCIWSAHAPQSGQSPSPFPRDSQTLSAAPGKLFLFGGYLSGHASSDLYVISTSDFSTTLLQTSGEAPAPRFGHGAALTSTTLLICGGMDYHHHDDLNHDSLYLLDLGTSDLLMSSLTPVDHSFGLQFRESGPALWSMDLDRALVATKPQPLLVPSSSSSVVILAGRSSMICGHSIGDVVRFSCCCSEPF